MKDKILKEIKRLVKGIRRSLRRDREMWIRGTILAVVLLLIVILIGRCACGKNSSETVDKSATEVMTITVAPSPTPTEVPRQVSSDAVATNGDVTMVNEYLVQKEEGTADASETAEGSDTAAGSDAANSGETQSEGDGQ